jgi:hypothetical protein
MATLVQQQDSITAGTTGNVTLNGITAGNFLALAWVIRTGASFTSAVGSLNSTFTQAVAPQLLSARAGIHYFANSASGNETVTLTAGASDTILLNLSEWSGLATSSVLDQANGLNTNVTTTTHSHGSITTASNCGLVITCSGQSSTVTDETVASGFTAFQYTNIIAGSGSNNRVWWQYANTGTGSLTTTGAYTTAANSSSCGVIASFLNAGGGGGGNANLFAGKFGMLLAGKL